MQNEFSPTFTRFDAMQWFLRVEFWLSVVALIFSFAQPYMLMAPVSWLQNLVSFGFPVLVLGLFSGILANGSLGRTGRDSVTTLAELRPLVWRCVGLTLFVQTLGSAVLYSLYLIYSMVPLVSSAWLFGTGVALTYVRFQIATTVLRFVLGFVLAFGPAIRDNFRGR